MSMSPFCGFLPRRPPTVSNGSIWCRRFSTEPTANKNKDQHLQISVRVADFGDLGECESKKRGVHVRDQINLDFVPIRILAQKNSSLCPHRFTIDNGARTARLERALVDHPSSARLMASML